MSTAVKLKKSIDATRIYNDARRSILELVGEVKTNNGGKKIKKLTNKKEIELAGDEKFMSHWNKVFQKESLKISLSFDKDTHILTSSSENS